ncbi:MAG: hypothetical protein ACE5JI_20160 [Acidobacteriota bacterium]
MREVIHLLVFWSLAAGAHSALAEDNLSCPWPDGAEIEQFLKKAKITERVKIGTGITNPEKVTLELDGQVRHAIFKKVDKNHDNWRCEVAAYQLDKLLGLGMVPPTVERRVRGRKGCLQLWVTGVTMQKFEENVPDLEEWRRQVSVMWLFDDLIANIDRHLNNAIVSPEHRLILIDNSKTFRSYRSLLNDLNSAGTGTHARFWVTDYQKDRMSYPTTYPADIIARLRSVTDKDIKKAIGRYIWGYNRDLVAKRRKLILERLERMQSALVQVR